MNPIPLPAHSITLTGIDDSTELSMLERIAMRYPSVMIEWAVLHNPRHAGTGRFASAGRIEELFDRLWGHLNIRLAVHLCGEGVSDFLRGQNRVVHWAKVFDRVQLNLVAQHETGLLLARAITQHNTPRIVLQHNTRNTELVARLDEYGVPSDRCDVLFDASGGRGKLPVHWPDAVVTDRRVGFAGGLGPKNLSKQLPLIAKAASKQGATGFWVAMESSLRDVDDRFSVDHAEECVKLFSNWQAEQS